MDDDDEKEYIIFGSELNTIHSLLSTNEYAIVFVFFYDLSGTLLFPSYLGRNRSVVLDDP